MAVPQNLSHLLQHAAQDPSNRSITIYTDVGTSSESSVVITYNNLLERARQRSVSISALIAKYSNDVILLHSDNFEDGIVWFWSIVLAGGIPCMSTPLSKDIAQREIHIRSLQTLLKDPVVLSSQRLVHEFQGVDDLRLKTFEDLNDEVDNSSRDPSTNHGDPGLEKRSEDIATLMLTSGSTGASKAVALRHGQIITSIKGKTVLQQTNTNSNFMNWTSLDHVAGLIEIHLHALGLAANQIHIPGAPIVANPLIFLQKVSEHRISYTFGPNFFLANLVQKLESFAAATHSPTTKFFINNDVAKLDLSCLRALNSGGEVNVVATCATLTTLLQSYNAPKSFIRPGFGMTETCAGSIYNVVDCPSYDISQSREFACLGDPLPGIERRIVRDDGLTADTNEAGELQVTGKVVFQEYYNDLKNTRAAFSQDGWFKTGDRGFLDDNGRLHLTGRYKDTIIINSINHFPQAIENAIEAARIPGVTPTFTVVFAHRPVGSGSETMCVVYLPEFSAADAKSRFETSTAISTSVVTYSGVRPYKVIPLNDSFLQKSSLGKLSRSAIRKAFEEGKYDGIIKLDAKIIATYKKLGYQPAATPMKNIIVEVFQELFGLAEGTFSVTDDLFSLGLSSIDVLGLQINLQKRLNIEKIPITLIFAQKNIRELAQSLEKLRDEHVYDPIVVLQSSGEKPPIFFIHPGVGEVLIFMNLSRYFTDRPVYALRARGFDGEEYFSSMDEVVSTYHVAIKKAQPHGPYSILGYSFGSVLAFEIAKIMEKQGDELAFLGSIDQAPFFKQRARNYDWAETVMTIAFFLGLIEEAYAYSVLPQMKELAHSQVLDHIFSLAPAARIAELGITRKKLDNWAGLAFQLKAITWDYDPVGFVKHMDVFYTQPLIGIVKAKSLEEWFSDYISRWNELVEEAKFHVVGGTHRTLISPPNLDGFWKIFKGVLDEREFRGRGESMESVDSSQELESQLTYANGQ